MIISGAKIICECLLEQGVDTVFGIPGGQIINIYDELYKYRNKIRHILTVHEQGAAHAADGYARATGKAGVVFATSGPGATNLVTGIAAAYMDSVPMVAITGNVALPLLGRDSFQEVDIAGITMPITKHNYIVKDVNKLAGTIREAFLIARSGRPGPVLIDIPKDIAILEAEYTFTPQNTDPQTVLASDKKIKSAAKMISSAKRPLIYAGGGVVSSDACESLKAFAEKISAPVCTSLMGKTCIDARLEYNLGMVGMHGTVEAAQGVEQCDLLVAVGARFSDRVAGDRQRFADRAKVIHIDIDGAEISKNVHCDLRIESDAADALLKITSAVDAKRPWAQKIYRQRTKQKTELTPGHVLETLRELMDQDDILTTDVGQHQMWAAQYFDTYKTRTFLTSGGLGAMGYGLGAAIGAKAAYPSKRVVCVTGDGSFHMNMNELVTAVTSDLPIVVLIMNNGVLGMVRQWQKMYFDNRFSNTDLNRKTNYVTLAQALGAKGYQIVNPNQIRNVLQKALNEQGTVVIDCKISCDENVLPMIPPGKNSNEMITLME